MFLTSHTVSLLHDAWLNMVAGMLFSSLFAPTEGAQTKMTWQVAHRIATTATSDMHVAATDVAHSHVALSACLRSCLSVCLSVCLSLCLSVAQMSFG